MSRWGCLPSFLSHRRPLRPLVLHPWRAHRDREGRGAGARDPYIHHGGRERRRGKWRLRGKSMHQPTPSREFYRKSYIFILFLIISPPRESDSGLRSTATAWSDRWRGGRHRLRKATQNRRRRCSSEKLPWSFHLSHTPGNTAVCPCSAILKLQLKYVCIYSRWYLLLTWYKAYRVGGIVWPVMYAASLILFYFFILLRLPSKEIFLVFVLAQCRLIPQMQR